MEKKKTRRATTKTKKQNENKLEERQQRQKKKPNKLEERQHKLKKNMNSLFINYMKSVGIVPTYAKQLILEISRQNSGEFAKRKEWFNPAILILYQI